MDETIIQQHIDLEESPNKDMMIVPFEKHDIKMMMTYKSTRTRASLMNVNEIKNDVIINTPNKRS